MLTCWRVGAYRVTAVAYRFGTGHVRDREKNISGLLAMGWCFRTDSVPWSAGRCHCCVSHRTQLVRPLMHWRVGTPREQSNSTFFVTLPVRNTETRTWAIHLKPTTRRALSGAWRCLCMRAEIGSALSIAAIGVHRQ